MSLAEADQGDVLVVQPDGGDNYWQPVPANGFISVHLAPHLVGMNTPFGLGTQTVPPGGYVREHAHPHHDEVLHFISGTGKAVIEGEEHRLYARHDDVHRQEATAHVRQ